MFNTTWGTLPELPYKHLTTLMGFESIFNNKIFSTLTETGTWLVISDTCMLHRIWDTNKISRKTKIKLFKSIVRAVLMYDCETKNSQKQKQEAGHFPIQMHEMHDENKVATNDLATLNP